ncbi:rhomboid family intramembrane serine protease [Bremerella cremea]|uniref:rhomboid family intramembrane serine protease n=1 Tax=Bremerella cremea TaxID=1031537 RepID=UPI0031E9A19C
MRQIGKLSSENEAARFTDYLLTLGIHSKADPAQQGEWSVWIHEENQVEQARTELEAFRSNPDDARYRKASDEAAGIRKMEQLREKERRKNIHEVKHRSPGMGTGTTGAPVTRGILALCIGILLLGVFDSNYSLQEPGIGDQVYNALSFLSPEDLFAYLNSPEPNSLKTIERGQVWRLITPAILHQRPAPNHQGMGWILHIGFNMYMLYMLGPTLERRIGSLHFLLLNLALAIASNLAQGVIPMLLYGTDLSVYERYYGGVSFLGYSGVLYGLFGYIWARSNNDLTFGLRMDQSSVVILMVWFFLCWFGMMGGVANLAHTGGLVAGLGLGYVAAIMRR